MNNATTEAEREAEFAQADQLYEVTQTFRGGEPQRIPADSFAIDVRAADGRHYRIAVTYTWKRASAPWVWVSEVLE